MDDAVGALGTAAEAGEVFEVAAEGGAARGGDEGGVGVGAGEAEDGMAVGEEFFDGGLADEAGGAGYEDLHVLCCLGWGLEDLYKWCLAEARV